MRLRLPRLRRLSTPAIIIATAASTAVLVTATSAAAVTYYVKLNTTNYGTAQTTIKNANGTPLGLYAKTGYAPLYVNSTKAVSRLNADYVDGYHASSFAKVTGKTGLIYAADKGAVCPAGTVATGGGGDLFHLDPAAPDDQTKWVFDIPIGYSGPDVNATTGAPIPNSWIVLPMAGTTNFGIDAFVECYNPKGAVPGAVSGATTTAQAKAAARLKTALVTR
jgi:hypothetical protein